ncbi:MAG: hypothetical protein LBE76_02885 [Nitrososphaerota archaeon]|nr:hypothetical protein [Nitrososphaerota archaeon]
MSVKFRASRWPLLFASLFAVVLASSLFVSLFVNDTSGASLTDVVHVKNEAELKEAINNAPSSKAVTIALDNDITLTNFIESSYIYNYYSGAIIIPANKDITLTSSRYSGFYKLISDVDIPVILVGGGGILRIDGIIVTHKNGVLGCGVQVLDKVYDPDINVEANVGGVLYLYSGEISGNTREVPLTGGGVSNIGTFIMSGGKISDNSAGGHGGGVYNGGVFKMLGGEISDNTASSSGGGVYNGYYGSFSMSGGTISGNTAMVGGGVCSQLYFGTFEWVGGTISSNIATSEGNDVYPDDSSNTPDGNSGGSSNSGNGQSVEGFSVDDVLVICVVIIVALSVAMVILFFTFKKRIRQAEGKQNKL